MALPGTGDTWIEGTVEDGEGRPVPGAVVEVYAVPRGDVPVLPLLHASATAGPDGRFRVGPGPSPWWFQGSLQARAPGYVRTALVSSGLALQEEQAVDPGKPVRLVLRKGLAVRGTVRARDGGPPDGIVTIQATRAPGFTEVLEADAAGNFSFLAPPGPLRVQLRDGPHPGAVASMEVAEGAANTIDFTVNRGRDVRGKVVDMVSGKPVPGAVLRSYYGETRIHVADAKGEFLLPKYWYRAFQVRAPGYAVRAHNLASVPGTVAADAEVVRLPRGLVARGRVTDLDGRPVAGARLRTFARDPGGDWLDLSGPLSRKDGTYTFVGIPMPGEGREIRVLGATEGFGIGMSRPVEGKPGAVVDGADLRIPRLVEVAGSVEDENGAPAEGWVSLRWDLPPEQRPYSEGIPSVVRTRAGPDGRWMARAPERVRLHVTVRGDAFQEALVETDSPAHPASAPDPARKPPSPVRVRVVRGLSIRGTVRDAGGNPVGWGDVRVEPSPASDHRPSQDAAVRRDGTFEAGGLAEGLYDISVVSPPDFLQQVRRGIRAGGEPVDVVLRRPGGIVGKVVLPPGAPATLVAEVVATALEDAHPLPPVHGVRVDASRGLFSLGPLAPGPYALSARAGEWRIDVPRVVVGEGDPTVAGDLLLAPGAAVAGTVACGGRPAEGAALEVFLVAPDGRLRAEAQGVSGPGGRFRLAGLLPGPHLLTARPRDRPLVQARFEAVTGEDAAVAVEVPEGARLSVKALDAAGAPVPGARVTLTRDGEGLLFWKEGSAAVAGPHATDASGVLSCTGVPAGEVEVLVERPGSGRGQAKVVLKDGEAAPVEVRLDR